MSLGRERSTPNVTAGLKLPPEMPPKSRMHPKRVKAIPNTPKYDAAAYMLTAYTKKHVPNISATKT